MTDMRRLRESVLIGPLSVIILSILAYQPCQSQTYNLKFGVDPTLYPPDTVVNLHHNDALATWFVAPATGTIDSMYWLAGDTVGAKDSTLYFHRHFSRITPTFGPGANYPPPPLPWGYFINTNDPDRGIAAYADDATPPGPGTWTSTVPSATPSVPPFTEEIFYGLGLGITVHAGKLNTLAMLDLGSNLDVYEGQAFFLSLRIKGWYMHVDDAPSQFRATHSYMPNPSHSWMFYEHDSVFGPGSVKGWWAVGGASVNVWYNMKVTDPSSTLIQPGWNLLALTNDAADDSVIANFPASSGSAFHYAAGKYEGGNATMTRGAGYWLKFPAATTRTLSVGPKGVDSLAVKTGWNMIGTFGPIFVQSIQSSPPGIIASKFWRYDSSYVATTIIFPWRAYWVKVSQDGMLFTHSSGSLPAQFGKQSQVISEEMPPPPPDNGIVSPPQSTPHGFMLEQNYPNPLNPSTTIHYSLRDPSYVRLKVYNVAGQLVSKLVDAYQEPGEQSVRFEAGDLPSGIYYYELIAGNRTELRKMVVVR